MDIQTLLSWRPGSTQLWVLGCLAAWLVSVWLITRILPRPSESDDDEQARDVSRPVGLDDGAEYLRLVRKEQKP